MPKGSMYDAPIARFEQGYIPEPNSGCWLWIANTSGRGYGQFRVEKSGSQIGAHLFSYATFKGPIPPGMMVRHKCDTPACVNPDHLLVGTAQDNVDDAIRRGRHAHGEMMGAAKLADEQVLKIRAAMGRSAKLLAQEYGVSVRTIHYVRQCTRWKHLLPKEQSRA